MTVSTKEEGKVLLSGSKAQLIDGKSPDNNLDLVLEVLPNADAITDSCI